MIRRSASRIRADATAGFLLTETLATFTISAFVLLGLVSATSVLLGAIDHSLVQVETVDDLGRTLDAIARDVSGLARARWSGFEPQPFVFRGGANSLFFALADRNPDGTSTTKVVALREIVSGPGTLLMRGEARLSARATGFDSLRFGQQRPLATGSARLRYIYIGADAHGAERRLRDWPMSLVLPRAVVVEARDRDSGRLIVAVRVSIRANADIGCIVSAQSGGLPKPPPVDPDVAAAFGSPAPQTPSPSGPPTPGTATPGGTDQAFCGRTDKDLDATKPQADARTTP